MGTIGEHDSERWPDTSRAGADFVLRAAGPGDVEFLTDMVVAAVNWPADRDWSRERVMADPRLAHYIAGWPRPGDLGLVATTRDGEPIGATWVRYLPADDRGYGYVRADVPELTIGVVAAWRGKGVGHTLLRELLAAACEAGIPAVSLSVERANPAARLYAAEGFRVVGADGDADTMIALLSAA